MATAVLIAPGAAHADGDPASDVLYTQSVFLPFGNATPANDQARLRNVVASAREKGYRIKVAVIAAPSDLGTAFSLWRKPQAYARFLGKELVFLYKGRLLIAMPNGFGVSRAGKTSAERAALTGIAIPASAAGLTDAAARAVARLATEAGHPVSLPKNRPASNATRDRIVLVLAALVIVAVAVALRAWKRRRVQSG